MGKYDIEKILSFFMHEYQLTHSGALSVPVYRSHHSVLMRLPSVKLFGFQSKNSNRVVFLVLRNFPAAKYFTMKKCQIEARECCQEKF